MKKTIIIDDFLSMKRYMVLKAYYVKDFETDGKNYVAQIGLKEQIKRLIFKNSFPVLQYKKIRFESIHDLYDFALQYYISVLSINEDDLEIKLTRMDIIKMMIVGGIKKRV